jgi:hypothetical protein
MKVMTSFRGSYGWFECDSSWPSLVYMGYFLRGSNTYAIGSSKHNTYFLGGEILVFEYQLLGNHGC